MQGPWFRPNNIRYWYFRFKDSEYYSPTLIVITMVICVLLLFYVLIPQTASEFSIRNEVLSTQASTAVINQNVSYLSTLDKTLLTEQLQATTMALPDTKNFSAISNAITYATEASGVSLEDFSFQIGELSGSQGANDMQTTVELTVDGDVDAVRRFIQSLYNVLPVSSVTDIEGTTNSATITIQFFSMPYSLNNYPQDQALLPLTASQTKLLQEISTWQDHTPLPQSAPASSASGSMPLF